MATGKSGDDLVHRRERTIFHVAVPLLLLGVPGALIVDWRSAREVAGFLVAAIGVVAWRLAASRAAERSAKQSAPPAPLPSVNEPRPRPAREIELQPGPSLGSALRPGQITVPEGHRIHCHSAALVPTLVQSAACRGGAP